jgi:phage baseplate assembly protein W
MAIQTIYKDFPLSFRVNPITKDIPLSKNEDAVKKALLNLLKTQKGTRPFRPDFGVNLQRFLFEPADYETEVQINDEIARSIQVFEPRVQVIEIESVIDNDVGIKVAIKYYVRGVPKEQILETTISNRVT